MGYIYWKRDMLTDREKCEFIGPVRSVRAEIENGPSRSYKLLENRRELWKDYSDSFTDHSNSTNEQSSPYEIFIFDPTGRLIEDASAERQWIEQEPYGYIYRYDEKGRIDERLSYNEDGSPSGKTI